MAMYDQFLDYDKRRLHRKADDALMNHVVPVLREAIAAAAPQLVEHDAPDNPFQHYAAAELLIKRLCDLLTLSDTDELDRLTPPMLADPQFADYWIRKLS